ncbi:guanine nucleotide exchange protein for ADP-robosylation factor [Dimargaris xerosporica]|nr:guanine nucleotide exchange protein for ADP-robosylation factor [Dimargaris xerosporica]
MDAPVVTEGGASANLDPMPLSPTAIPLPPSPVGSPRSSESGDDYALSVPRPAEGADDLEPPTTTHRPTTSELAVEMGPPLATTETLAVDSSVSVTESTTTPKSAPVPARPSSVATTHSTAPSTGSSLASVHFFIVNDLEKLLKTKEGRRDRKLKDALTAALDALKQPPAGDALTDQLMEPLRLACQTENPAVVITALDCIEKLISYRFFEQTLDAVPTPVSPGSASPGVLDQLVDTVCDCFVGEVTDEKVQLQVVKAVLAAVSYTSSRPEYYLHQAALLKAVRTIYNIYLLSRSESNQTLAQGTLAQIVHIIFGRVKITETSPDTANLPENTSIPESLSVPGTPVPELHQGRDASEVPGVPAAAASAPLTGEDSESPTNALPKLPANNPAAGIYEGPLESDTRTSVDGIAPNANAEAIRDAFSLFRALCKLSMKTMAKENYNDIRILSLRSRLLALHLVHILLNSHLDVFTSATVTLRTQLPPTPNPATEATDGHTLSEATSPHAALHPPATAGPDQAAEFVTIPFIGVVKQYLSLSLTRNLVSPDFGVFEVSLAILARSLVSLRKYLRKEIEVLFREIVLPTIEMRHSGHLQRSCLLQCLQQICNDPQTLIEIYLNYDCSPDAAINLYERLVNTLSKLAAGSTALANPVATAPAQTPDTEAPYVLPMAMFLPHAPGDLRARPTIPPSLTTSAVNQALLAHREYLIPDDYSLKCQSIEAITAILRSLVTWVNRGLEVAGVNPRSPSPGQLEGPIPDEASAGSTVAPPSQSDSDGASHRSTRGPSPSPNLSLLTATHHPVLGTVTTDDPEQLKYFKQRKQQLEDGIRLFNWKPKKGIRALAAAGFMDLRDPQSVARFFRTTEGLNKAQLGEYLGEGDTENIAIMHAYVDSMQFVDLPFVTALREFLQGFRLPGESQKIDRFMLKFAERYVEGNPETFANADTAYVLAYSVIMLNTDAHSPQVKHRMTKQDFVKNNRGIDENADLPEEYLGAIYDEIQNDEIILKDEHDPLNAINAHAGLPAGGGRDGTAYDPNTASTGLGLALDVLRRRNSRYEYFANLSREMANKSEALIKEMLRKQSSVDMAKESDLFYHASHVEHVRPMFEIVWMAILAGISGPAQQLDDPVIIHLCLESFKHAIHIATTFDMELERDAFVSTLAKFTVLADLMEMKPKNIEAIKTLLDVAAVDGNHLRQSWLDVLTCASQLERLQLISDHGASPGLHGGSTTLLVPAQSSTDAGSARSARTNALATGTSANAATAGSQRSMASSPTTDRARGPVGSAADKPVRRSALMTNKPKSGAKQYNKSLQLADLSRLDANSQSLVVAVDRIFTSSYRLSGTAIVEFVRALSQVSWEEIQSSTFDQQEQPRLYSLQKIVEISYYNMGRIRMEWSNVWAILGTHFHQVGCHPNVQVGFFALDSLRQLSMKFLEKEELAHFKFQKDFLQPFHFILENSPDVAIKDMVLRCLQHIIRSRSDRIRSGWKTILSALASAARETTEPIVTMAFEIVREVCRERFNDIVSLGSFPELVLCLTEFCTSAMHQRTSLQSIEMLYLCAKNLAARFQESAPVSGYLRHQAPNGGVTNEKNTSTAPTAAPSASASTETHASPNGGPPSDDPVYRLWFPIFHAMYNIIMNCDDLEVRTKALNYLFEFLKSNGATFSFAFWSLILQDVVYPIFRDLKSPEPGKRFGRQEDITFWFSTTLIKALRNLIDLFTHYYDVLSPTLDSILELLSVCITQESETLARIGSACFQELVENNYHRFDDGAWRKVCQTFLFLFTTSVPHVLFEMSGQTEPSTVTAPSLRGTPAAPVKSSFNFYGRESPSGNGGGLGSLSALNDDGSGGTNRGAAAGMGSGAPDTGITSHVMNPLQNRRKSWKGDPQTEYQRITLKCVLQLLLIQTVDELFHANTAIYQAVDSDQLFFVLDCLDKSYQFAKKFNADVQLRLALVESGFMTQVPSLLKQEVSSLQCSLAVLQQMYTDSSPERTIIVEEVEDRLVPLIHSVLVHFNRIDPRTAEHHIKAWQPVVMTVFENLLDLDATKSVFRVKPISPPPAAAHDWNHMAVTNAQTIDTRSAVVAVTATYGRTMALLQPTQAAVKHKDQYNHHAPKPLQVQAVPDVCFYFVRHGERRDHVDPSWADSTPRPHDPPLSDNGIEQAYVTGRFLHDLEREGAHSGKVTTPLYWVFTSPFLRCVQTAGHIIRGLKSRTTGEASPAGPATRHIEASSLPCLHLEPGLGEWMSDQYFTAPIEEDLVATRHQELARGADAHPLTARQEIAWDYQPLATELAAYPESFPDLATRIEQTLSGLVRQVTHRAQQLAGSSAPRRVVVVLVTHGACINKLLWATTRQFRTDFPDYCCLARARLRPAPAQLTTSATPALAQLSYHAWEMKPRVLALAETDHLNLPPLEWHVDAQVYAGHLKL